MILSTATTAIVISIATIGAYSLVRFKYRGRESLAFLVLFTYLLPSVVLILPLYLSFVRLLVCRFVRNQGFDWVVQDPIVHENDIPKTGGVIDGVTVFDAGVDAVVDELAHAVLAQRRQGKELPKLLRDYADVFSSRLGA